jgi:hypothetical protein
LLWWVGDGRLLWGVVCDGVRLPVLWLALEGLWLPHGARARGWGTVGSCGAALRGAEGLLLGWAAGAHAVGGGGGGGRVAMVVLVFTMFLPVFAVAVFLRGLLVVFVELVQDITSCHEFEPTEEDHVGRKV